MNTILMNSFIAESCPTLDDKAKQSLTSWLSGIVTDAPISSNLPSQKLPFQRWYNFKEAFSPVLVAEAISCLGFWPTNCLDCFGGSGTTALTCQFLGIEPTTIEVNPFLADLIEAKLAVYNQAALKNDFNTVMHTAKSIRIDFRSFQNQEWPSTMFEPGLKGRWLYQKETFRRILQLKHAIEVVVNPTNRRFLRVLLGSILVNVSNVVISGKGRRYRSDWESKQQSPEQVSETFQIACDQAFADIAEYSGRLCQKYTLHRGDARTQTDKTSAIDIALFSPPYPNSFDYTDIYNVELWVLGYLKTRQNGYDLRTSTLRSHVQIKRSMAWPDLKSNLLKSTVEALKARQSDLWNPNLPDMIGAYFYDLDQILRSIRSRINPDGAVLLTVGDSRYVDVMVDVGDILAELAPGAGYVCEKITPIRSMKTSSQQGGLSMLSEDLVHLRPV